MHKHIAQSILGWLSDHLMELDDDQDTAEKQDPVLRPAEDLVVKAEKEEELEAA